MKLLAKYSLTCLALFLFVQCQTTDVPEPFEGTPVFTLSAQLPGGTLDLKAGLDDFYMYTSHDKDSCNRVLLQGRLAKTDSCQQQCEETFRILIADASIVLGDPFDIAAALSTSKDYNFLGEMEPVDSFSVQFKAIPEGMAPFSYSWDFGDENQAFVADPIHRYALSNPEYNVQLSTIDAAGCERFYEQTISADTSSNSCRIDFSANNLSPTGSIILLEALPAGLPPFTFQWSTGTTGSIDTLFADSTNSFLVCLQMIDETGCLDNICKEISVEANTGMIDICATRFDYSISTDPDQPSLCASGIVLEYTDPGGTIYRSDAGPKQAADFFEIDAVADFDNNEKGEKTQKVDLRFSATLYSEDGESLAITNATAVFGFAYPEN